MRPSINAKLLAATALATLVACTGASSALAAPELGVNLARTFTPLTHGDERAVYEVTVSNTAGMSPSVGEELTCSARYKEGGVNGWFNVQSFTFRWLSNGAPATGPTAQPTATTSTYVVQAADEGHALQCEVLGQNSIEAAASYAPPLQVEPPSSPPAPSAQAGASNVRPTVANAPGHQIWGLGTRTCSPPPAGSWSGSPSWTFQWLKNGVPIPGATSSELTPELEALGTANAASGSNVLTSLNTEEGSFAVGQKIVGGGVPPGTTITAVGASTLTLSATATRGVSGERYESGPDVETNIQCEAIGTTGSGEAPGGATVLTVSPNLFRIPGESAPPNNNTALTVATLPFLSFASTTTGPITLEVQLPGGEETYAYRAIGTEVGTKAWSCTKEAPTSSRSARVFCTRSDPLAPQSSYPPVEVIERPGHDAPDILTTKAIVSGGGAAAANAEDSFTVGPAVPFGFEGFFAKVLDDLGNDYTQAGGHPFSAVANVQFTDHIPAEVNNINTIIGLRALNGRPRIVTTDTPRGFVGNPQAVKPCASTRQVTTLPPSCPPESVVGGISLETPEGWFHNEPIFEVEPEVGAPAQFAFGIPTLRLLYTLTPELRPGDGYAISLVSSGIPKTPELLAAPVVLCGFGAKPLVPSAAGTEEREFTGCRRPHEAGAGLVPFLTNPTRCAVRPTTRISADTWEDPGSYAEASYAAAPLTGCDKVPFEPRISLKPTSNRADSPTGLDVTLSMPTEELEEADGIAQANLAGATVTLPEGMAVNPALASGLEACGEAQFGMHEGVPDGEPVRCPQASKIGTAEVRTPLVADTLAGSVYVASQGKNPFGSLLALYMDLESKRDGLLLKVAGKVTPDPVTGRLTTTFVENPEAPFSELKLHFASGQRAPLLNPPRCGRYQIESELWPWTAADPRRPTSAETVSQTSTFQVARGPDGGPCPHEDLEPHLSAGVAGPVAGTTSPFVLNLSRADGSQRFSALDASLPPGLTAFLRGVPYCPEAALASISEAEGAAAAEVASPACPAASQIGTVTVGAGAGEDPFYLGTGRAYLAGPYKGAPLSIAIVTPALAGPFDLGNVLVRSGLYLDLETAQVTVKSDPIPTILHGLLLDVRDVRVNIDRSHFILSPTNCEPMAVEATVHGPGGESAAASDRFQVGGCERLKFKPQLKLHLKGATGRSGHPALKAVVSYPKQGAYANIARAQVGLPHSEFLDQGNLDKVCTQPQLRSATCPKRSIYGHAKAWTPLLDKPLEGPVYIGVGYGHKLPDLVADLNGQVRILLHGRVDTTKQHGIRNTFEVVPDAPVSRFVLEMKGGKKYGLLENSEDICRAKQRASARFVAHNGLVAQLHPEIRNSCGQKHRAKKKSHRAKSGSG